jgi:zinc protease
MPTHVETLENGLKVILRPIPETKALSTWVVYRIGSRNEVPGMTGSTHWVEHMLFKGGGKLGKGDIDKLISRLGGKMNAFTDTDYTMYFETIPASEMDTSLMIESERMRNAAFDPKEVEAERTVVISEREGAENQPEFAVEEELWGLAFHVHPYHWTPIGYKGDLATLDRDRLYDHYRRYYAPNNASLILVGGFDPAVAMQHIREAFSPLRPEAPPGPVRLVEPDQQGERRSDLERPGPADLLCVGWHIPAAGHEDVPALMVLSTLLGGWRGLVPFAAGGWRPRSNRLYRALVETKLATDVGVRLEAKIDPSLLIVNATLAAGASLDRVEAVLDRVVEGLRRTPAPKAEMERARQQLRAWSRYEQDGVTFQGILMGAGEGLSSWDFAERLLGAAEKVRPDRVRDVARTYLVDAHRSVVRFHAQEGRS